MTEKDSTTNRDDGGAAFPESNSGGWAVIGGMSLRDYFAAQALTGLMGDSGLRPKSEDEFLHMAKRLYQVADAMLRERAK